MLDSNDCDLLTTNCFTIKSDSIRSRMIDNITQLTTYLGLCVVCSIRQRSNDQMMISNDSLGF